MKKNILTIIKSTELTGIGTWNFTFLKAIRKKVLTIDIWIQSNQKREDSLLIQKLKTVSDNIYFEQPDKEYDIIYTNYYQDKYPKTKKIYHFVHNIMSNNYMNPYADKYFCFSERSYNYLNDVDINKKELIRNAIDLTRFKKKKTVNKVLKNVLVFDSRNNGFLNYKVLAACSKKGIYMSFLGEDLNHKVVSRWNVEKYIESADLVIAVGRSAIEALAMGKSVIIGNYNQMNGLVTRENFAEHAETNFSGWTKYRVDDYDASYFVKQFNKYTGENLRDLISKQYDIKKYAESTLTII